MTELRTDQPAAHRAAGAHRPRRTAWTAAGAGLLAAAAAAADRDRPDRPSQEVPAGISPQRSC